MPRSSRSRFRDFVRDLHGNPSSSPSDAKSSTRPQHRSFWQLFRQFWKLLGARRRHIAVALALVTVSSLLKLAPPAATKLVIDYVLPGHSLPGRLPILLHLPQRGLPLLCLLAVGVLAISLVGSLMSLWGRSIATLSTKRLQVAVRKRVFRHAAQLPLHRVYQLKSGGVSSILREDAGGIGDLIFALLYNPWRAVIQLLGSICVLTWVDWRLLAGSLVLVPCVYLSHRTWISRIRPLYRQIRRQRQEIDSHATEAFGGMRVVRAFSRSRNETSRFARGGHLMARQEMLAWWWSRLVELAWEALLPVASAALLLYGGAQVLHGQLSIGDLMMFIVYLAMLLEPLAVLVESATAFQNNLAGLERVLDLLAEPIEMPAAAGAVTIERGQVVGRLTLRNVSFRYPGSDEWVLKNINVDVEPGQTVALVGPSGAGKTTFCNLVARFYDPTSGAIELDGVDLRGIRVESYRRLLGIVEQDVFLFDGTVADNIGYALRHARQSDIERAARIANAHEFIEALPDGYQTLIGERGVRLSGGQRQRLAIARAVLADARIFILDEATSNLDTDSERLIQQSLRGLMRGRTSFVIAHRLSTVKHADRILVITDGQIVETGTHAELIAQSGLYRHMVHVQLAHTDGASEQLDATV
jgi:ATP-binding cassette subfamily B protein/subfamily B ATP-binding cassette protein MsbA